MYEIKQVPEDFIVEELIVPRLGQGSYSYFWLKKRDRTTLNAIKTIASALRQDIKAFGWAGNKDRQAVTRQLVSVRNVDENILKSLKLKGIEIEYAGRGTDPINLGNNVGNKFIIIVRNIKDHKKIRSISIINYFDEQRFSEHNVEIGRSIVKRDFKKAVELILKTKSDMEFKKAVENNKKDHVGALRKINKKLLLLYIHAYQSYLFNEAVRDYLNNKYKKFKKVSYSLGELLFPMQKIRNEKIQIIGFGTEPNKIMEKVMKNEKISPRDFIIRELPNMSVEGGKRDLIIDVKRLKISKLENDELNVGKKKAKVSFDLPKGNYATIVIKALF